MRISDWSSDVCSSDLRLGRRLWRGRIAVGAVDRQIDRKARPLPRLAVGEDEARRLFDDSIDGRKPEPGALADVLGREEGFENLGQHVGRYTGAGVADRKSTRLNSSH